MAYRAFVAHVYYVPDVRTYNHGHFALASGRCDGKVPSVTLPARNIHGVLRYCHAAEVHQVRLSGERPPGLRVSLKPFYIKPAPLK
ncbi:MAG TPA: hypothetical protein VKQ10_08125 [Spirochaetota bacterium]|nr:hypothetical protein [Spirochaetota bacterium]